MQYTFNQLAQEFILKECNAILAQTEAATGECSQKFLKIHRKTTVLESLFYATLLKKRLWHRCIPVSFAIFLRTPILQKTPVGLLLPGQIQTKLYFSVKSCLRTVDRHYTGKFLMQFWFRQIRTALYVVIFQRKNDYKQKQPFADAFQNRCS